MQIRNLSAPGLYTDGNILNDWAPDKAPYISHYLNFEAQEENTKFRVIRPLVLRYVSGMPLLVIYRGTSEEVFYLDRIVELLPGAVFSIIPLLESCGVEFCSAYEDCIEKIGDAPSTFLDTASSGLNFQKLYSFFYQECSSNLYFSGEKHQPYELVYVDIGVLHTLVCGTDIVLRQQEMMIIGSNDWHMQYSDAPVTFLTVSFYAHSANMNSITNQKLQLSVSQKELIQKMLIEHTKELYGQDHVESLLRILLVEQLREVGQMRRIYATQLPATLSSENAIVNQALQLISENIRGKLTLKMLAAMLHISVPYLHRLFQTYLGMSPGNYIAKIRIEECKAMLRTGSFSIGQTAEQMGFSSAQHFSRQFRSLCGMTPSEYVRSLR